MLTDIQVKQAVELYLKRSFTQYAVLIDGGWGVGKTHLLQNFILPAMADVRYFNISLYGLSTIADIENEIYKCVSLNGDEANAVFSQQEYFSSEMLEGARLGGVSYAVQFLVNRYQKSNGSDSPKLLLCFDDLERWAGDLNVCLSYVNKIVEQEQIKCILLGNLDALDEQGLHNLACAREKTIRHIYKFENPAKSIFTIALQLVDFQSGVSRAFVTELIDSNMSSLVDLMERVNERNIRTVSEALQLYEYIYGKNQQVFNRTERLPFTYFVTLLSTLILLKKYFVHKKERTELFYGDYQDSKGFALLKNIGYFDEDSPDYINDESKILLDTIFYRLDEISLKGVFSIIENGFYIEQDFTDSFFNWSEEKVYERYLDKYYFYQLEESEASQVINRILDIIFEQKLITNPATLLLLAERILNDIRRDVIELCDAKTSENFIDLIRELYESDCMDVVDLDYLDEQSDRYLNSQQVFHFLMELNRDYVAKARLNRQRSFWERLSHAPDGVGELMDEFDSHAFLKETGDPQVVVDALETLNNSQLHRFAQKLGEKNREHDAGESGTGFSRVADLIANELQERYESSYGIRASNMKEIAVMFSFLTEAPVEARPER